MGHRQTLIRIFLTYSTLLTLMPSVSHSDVPYSEGSSSDAGVGGATETNYNAATSREAVGSDFSNSEKQQKVFNIDSAMEYALDHNFDLARSRENINKQHHVTISARSGFYPSFGLNSLYTRTDSDRLPKLSGQAFGSTTNWNVEAAISYDLYSGGADSANSKRAEILMEAAKIDFKTVLQDVMAQVREKLYDVLLAKLQIEVQEQATKLLSEELESEKSKLKAGTVSDFNVLRAEVALANSKTPLIRARNQLKLAYEELRRVLGVSGDSDDPMYISQFSVEAPLEYVPIELSLEESLGTAMKERTDISHREKQIAAEQEGVNVARAGWFPKVTVNSSYGAEKNRFTDELDEEVDGWTAGIIGSWNFFDGYRTTSKIAQANSEVSLARIALAELRQKVNVEINRTHSTFLEAKELVSTSAKVSSQAEESLRLARARFNAGAGVQLDVLDSQVALTEAKTNHIRALHDYIVAVVRLKRAMGILDHVN